VLCSGEPDYIATTRTHGGWGYKIGNDRPGCLVCAAALMVFALRLAAVGTPGARREMLRMAGVCLDCIFQLPSGWK